MLPNFVFSIVTLVGVLVALLGIGAIVARLYVRATPERAVVRTGLGGQKVIMTGGAIVLPVFHSIIWVNQNTLRLEVRRDLDQSLITGDRLRVDVTAEFYVRVAPNPTSIAQAAQTLGNRTMDAKALKELVEGKFVDALRAAAAAMTMQELHAMRSDFVQNVKNAVSGDLAQNGLELESVSLTGLNQTSKEYFNPNNAFDAEGLLKLTQEIETRNKARNDIEQETRVQIEQKNLDATKRQLELKKEGETARLTTERDIAQAAAETQADIARTAAEGRRKAEEANLKADQEIATTRASTEKEVQTAEVNAKTAVQLRTQETEIQIADKSRDVAAAETAASAARADAVKAAERVETVRQVEVAERNKQVTLVKAEEDAREAATAVTVAAEAEQTAAKHRASAVVQLATGERDADVLRAEGIVAVGDAEGRALRARNESHNVLAPDLIAQQVKLALIQNLPAIIEQSVKPLLAIDSIRIAEVGGLSGQPGGAVQAGATGGGHGPAGGLGNEVVNAALRYRGTQPVVDALLAEVGLSGAGDMSKLTSSAAALAGVALAAEPAVVPSSTQGTLELGDPVQPEK